MAWYEFHTSKDVVTPQARECHTMNVLDERLILFAGNDNATRMNDVHSLDTSAWRRARCRPSFPVERSVRVLACAFQPTLGRACVTRRSASVRST